MKCATPPCRSAALLLRSRLPCPLRLALTTAYAMPSPLFGAQPYTRQMLSFKDFGTKKPDPTQAAPTSYALAVCVQPAGDSDVHLLQLLRVPGKVRIGDGLH
jgi:hypothetical protein